MFVDERTDSVIAAAEIPSPYTEIIKRATKEEYAATGDRLLSRREILFNGMPGILLHLSSHTHLKWIVFTGNEKETLQVTAVFPHHMTDRISLMEQLALSVKWDFEIKLDPLADLSFSFDEEPPLKFARRIYGGAMLTKDGVLSDKATKDPFFTIFSVTVQNEVYDINSYAKKLLMKVEAISSPVIRKQSAVTIAGLRGREIIAEARLKDLLPDTSTMVYFVFLVEGKYHVLMSGFAPLEEQEKYLPIFNRIAQSFRKK